VNVTHSNGQNGVERNAATLTTVVKGFEADGFTGQFAVRNDGMIECLTNHHRADAGRFETHALGRLEGTSDPDDELAVAAVICPICGTWGTLVVNYGPEAGEDDSLVLQRLPPPPSP
jgi:hypothetical protein